ncbi:ABC transporter substrate-binding protein [Psychromarinibacter sp. C21-152]|uniref:ABC transporter substrate-binding protein n=1 Tax=Psychromarinibacter sediminicola TaxID=3033385 RepID=A0AAE3NUQ4_9RHOB|nr:ABC transporter substrate-binding protein [Psychromarinibacter sediminicola]MDF0600962.1 ABC transporter substrate-binding protein [Psychromarinibacter sediminicola]
MTKNPTNWTGRDDAMVEDMIRRGATRRDLLRMLMASGAGLAAGGSVLMRATEAVAQTPVSGGSLRAAGWSTSTADTLDPAKATLSTDYVRCCSIYNRLTFLNEAGEVEMELAEEIASDDAKTWQVTLRDGITFHDGKPLTSADVVFSLQRHLDPAVGSKVNSIASQMSEISAVDDKTVKIVLSSANADLPTILALHHFMIVADGTTDFSKGNGTGAFIMEVFEPGVRSVVVKNPNYWKPEGPYLDSLEFVAISDDSARVNALLSGDIDYAGSVGARSMRLLKGQDSVETAVSTSGNYTNLNMRLDLHPGDKAGFVEGMKYLLNREAIQQSAFRGLAEIGNDQPVPPSNRYHNPNLKARDYDPERAKALFETAGLVGTEIPLVASDAANASVDMATILQQAGREIGMNFKVDRVPSDGYWSNYWLKAPVHFGNINPRPTPDILFSLLYASDAPWNESQYKSEKFDAMLIEARASLDEEKRTAIYWEMQEIVADDAGTAIPVYISNVDAHTTKMHGLKSNPLGNMMGYAFAEYVWLES